MDVPDYLTRELQEGDDALPLLLRIAPDDTSLYWWMALDIIKEIRTDILAGRPSVFILPVGPVYQYRCLLDILAAVPRDLSHVHLFFMDEYLDNQDRAVSSDHPLSFRGFIQRELAPFFDGVHSFRPAQLHFPHPGNPEAYDKALDDLGGATVCYAGVGINGHLAFNEAPSSANSPSRVVDLTPETITTNSHTALGGAYDLIPRRAVTVGMKSILGAKRLSLWMNRSWQRTVARKLLFGPVGQDFPASFARRHANASLVITPAVAQAPVFQLR